MALRLWEQEAMLKYSLPEDDYFKLSIPQRARMIVTIKIDQWRDSLENHRAAEEAKRKGGRGLVK